MCAVGAVSALGVDIGAPAPAKAEVLVSGVGKTVCATVYNNRLQLNRCDGGDAQNWFYGYGHQHYHNLCLDSETPNPGAQLVVAACQANKASQQWGLQPSGLMRNESGWCADVNGGNTSEGTRIQIWRCAANVSQSPHQLWAMGTLKSLASLCVSASVAQDISPGSIIANVSVLKTLKATGSGVVSTAGGNTVAAGGGNVVPASGKIVAAGGLNMIQLDSGAVLSH